jgi:DNA-directed RNA polymerase subunit L
MEINIILDEKETLEVELNNLTIAEVLRVYLNDLGAKLAVWKREHPTKNPILHIEGEKPKKLLKEAISKLEKEIDSFANDLKKLK